MTITITASNEMFGRAVEHLSGHIEQVGFFLADFEEDTERAVRRFALREWRPMAPEDFNIHGPYHVTLADHVRPQVIKWASDAGSCLVEAHSHGDLPYSAFSPTDLVGLSEWVPHVRWRLRRRPYAAIVTTEDSLDALAWVDEGAEPQQVKTVRTDDGEWPASGHTLRRLRQSR